MQKQSNITAAVKRVGGLWPVHGQVGGAGRRRPLRPRPGVWPRVKGDVKFSHIHGSHAQDIPLNRTAPVTPVLTADNGIEAVVVEGGNGAGTNRCRSNSLVL